MLAAKKTRAKRITILQKDSAILREISTPIHVSKIKSPEIKQLILELKKTIEMQKDAVAISAVQIGKPVRLFFISKRAFQISEGDVKKGILARNDMIFINPVITKVSKDKGNLEEGCLSVKYVYGKVKRSEKVFVEAFDENGKKFSKGLSGLFAQIVQHETDHLNGILFIDKAKELITLTPEEYERNLKELA